MILYSFGFIALAFFTLLIGALVLWPELRAQPKRSAISLFLLVAASAGLYLAAGSPALLAEYSKRESARDVALNALHAKEVAVKSAPESAPAWSELGDAYLKAGRPGMAVGALKRAVILSEGAPPILLAYGKAQVIAAGGKVSDDSAQAFRMALLQMHDAQAVLFLAMHTAEKGDSATAVTALEGLIKDHSTPEEVRRAAREQLSQISDESKR